MDEKQTKALDRLAQRLGADFNRNDLENIMEMDDPGNYEFSTAIVYEFIQRNENIFKETKSLIDEKKVDLLLKIGRQLEGESSTIGLVRIREASKKIKELWQPWKEEDPFKGDVESALRTISQCLGEAERALSAAKDPLLEFCDTLSAE